MIDCKFKIGDRVSDMGRKGTVSNVVPESNNAIAVDFDDGEIGFFSIDGKSHQKHTRPSLKKLKKKKARYYQVKCWGGENHHSIFNEEGDSVYGSLDGHWLRDEGTEKPKGFE
jgi:hypothetical protein